MPPDTLTLGFDTSAAHCAAALLSGDRVLAQACEPMQKGQAERLMALLEEVLAQNNATWQDLDAIGVGTGPGNFTGIRIAVSAARGLALSLGIPAVGVSTFEAQVLGVARPVASVVDARREQVYLQFFDKAEAKEAPLQLSADEAAQLISDRGCAAIGAAWNGPVSAIISPPPAPLAVAIAQLAAQRRKTELARPAPLYIRAADAAPPSDPAPVILS